MQTASSSTPSAQWTLRFTAWECGHHQAKPADITGIASPDQARLILCAIAAAISQPGSARAVLFNDTQGYSGGVCNGGIYLTDDYVDPDFPAKQGPVDRPIVICGDADTVAQIMGDGLMQARDSVLHPDLYAASVWDGTSPVDAFATVLTTQTREQVEARIARREQAYPPQVSPFELPPVLIDAAPVLEELRTAAAEQNAYDAEIAADEARAELAAC